MPTATPAATEKILEQIADAIQFTDDSRMSNSNFMAGVSFATSVITRLTPANSPYRAQAAAFSELACSDRLALGPKDTISTGLIGILQALKLEFEKNYVTTWTELIHADIFSDFLDACTHLLDEGYKDAAAVMCGGVLEQHIKKLCEKHNIPLRVVKKSGQDPKQQTTDELNIDLCKASVYPTLVQKNITAQLGIRNDAAHGDWTKYDKEQVRQMIQAVSHFIASYPA